MQKQNLDIEEHKNNLKKYFLDLAPDTNRNELDLLADQFTLDKFSKKEIILKAGDFSDTVYFVIKGIVRIYYIQENKEITTWFIKENMVFAATYSILTGEKNYNFYEALEDTYVLKIKYAELESFYSKYHTLEHLGRKLIEAYYSAFMKRTHDVLFLSAEDRYQIFYNNNNDILSRIPLKYVATYLGLSQETLSRMRAK